MGARGALLVRDCERLFKSAIVACAMSIDANKATSEPLIEEVQAARGQDGPTEVAALIRGHLAGSEILESHRENDPRVQDPYSIRCAAPVLGAAWDALSYVKLAMARELGAVDRQPAGARGRGQRSDSLCRQLPRHAPGNPARHARDRDLARRGDQRTPDVPHAQRPRSRSGVDPLPGGAPGPSVGLDDRAIHRPRRAATRSSACACPRA